MGKKKNAEPADSAGVQAEASRHKSIVDQLLEAATEPQEKKRKGASKGKQTSHSASAKPQKRGTAKASSQLGLGALAGPVALKRKGSAADSLKDSVKETNERKLQRNASTPKPAHGPFGGKPTYLSKIDLHLNVPSIKADPTIFQSVFGLKACWKQQ